MSAQGRGPRCIRECGSSSESVPEPGDSIVNAVSQSPEGQRPVQMPPRHLSVYERDRRYAALRDGLRDRGADCAIVCASNLFYLTNGILGERLGLLPTKDEPPTVTLHWRNLVDIPPEALAAIQRWVQDLRQGNDAS